MTIDNTLYFVLQYKFYRPTVYCITHSELPLEWTPDQMDTSPKTDKNWTTKMFLEYP